MITVKRNIVNIKNPNTGEYEGLPAIVGESAYQIAIRLGKFNGTEEEYINQLEVEKQEAIDAIQAKFTDILKNAPEDYAEIAELVGQLSAVRDSIPENYYSDYKELSDKVEFLNSILEPIPESITDIINRSNQITETLTPLPHKVAALENTTSELADAIDDILTNVIPALMEPPTEE